MNRSFLFLAQGFEEVEALTVVDVMRRAGMDIKTVSITDDHEVKGAHGIPVVADLLFEETSFDGAEWLIVPGGMPGASNLASCGPLCDLLKSHAVNGKVAAICASPAVVLAPLGILDGRPATCYPGFEDQMCGAEMKSDNVVALDRVITANGPAAATPFAFAIVANSMGEGVAQQVAAGMLC